MKLRKREMAMKPYVCRECGEKCWSLTEIKHSRPRCPDCWGRFVDRSGPGSDRPDHFIDRHKERGLRRKEEIARGKTRKVKEIPGKNVRPDAERYVDRIHNKNKKKYAREYLKWLQEGERGDSPEAEGIGVMAAQSTGSY